MILLLCNRENVNILILHAAADDDTKRRNDGIQKRHVSTYYLPRRRQKCAKSVLPMGRGPFESGKVHAAAGTAKQTPVEAH